VEEEDEEDEGDEAQRAETVAYMRSFMQCTRPPPTSVTRAGKGALLLKRRLKGAKAPVWSKALLSNGLECRSSVGGCKLRFVCRSEDVWFATAASRKMKRSGGGGSSSAKRRKLPAVLDGKGKDGPNALSGLGAGKMAPLPKAHILKPLPDVAGSSS